MSELRNLYPAIEPYEIGMLDVGDGHTAYFERVGKPGGKPWCFCTVALAGESRRITAVSLIQNATTFCSLINAAVAAQNRMPASNPIPRGISSTILKYCASILG